MREILFRGKRVDNGEWVEGYYVYDESGQNAEKDIAFIYRLNKHPCGYALIPYEVLPETVGQYTGLRDCKRTEEYPEGQKIFEGDIIRENYEYGAYDDFCVEFCLGGFNMIYIQTNKGKYAWYGENGEVVGNIHDNPELIGGGLDA